MTDPIQQAFALGQSIWYDGIRRSLLTSGDLERMVAKEGLRGMTSNPSIFQAAIAGSSDYAEAIAELASSGPMDAKSAYESLAVADIRAAKWMKLVSNATTLVITAILGLPMLEAGAVAGMRDLMLRAGQEALDAGRRIGHATLPIFGLTPGELGASDRIVELLLDTLYAGFVLPQTTTTILHDWIKGRRSEVDDINGVVVAELTRRGAPAPVNAAIVEIAHRIERRELEPDPANLALLHELVAADLAGSRRLA